MTEPRYELTGNILVDAAAGLLIEKAKKSFPKKDRGRKIKKIMNEFWRVGK